MTETILKAAKEYIDRQNRNSHPNGKFDNGMRWFPANEEHRSCCNHIRYPSRAYPFSLNKHCRSIEHIANLYSVNTKDLRKAVKNFR